MASNPNSRSGAQTAVDLARLAKAIYNIIRAAIPAGLHGAAAAAAKEALPLLIKAAAWALFFVLFFPILVFVSLPNIFFGFGSSETDPVIQMTEQAFTIGGAYMSLGEFERTQVDAIVTSLAAEYEEQGTEIDRIEVENDMDEEDLLWLIAINSVAHQQDLNTMSAESVREFCSAQLSVSSSLWSADGGEDGAVTTLKVSVEGIDPERLMEDLGFDEDAKTWAGALFETISESDAIETYGDYFAAYEPDYSGDSGWSGQVEYGSDYDNTIDISGFVSPETKNNLDLVAYAVQAWENNWGYVWGTYGSVLTESLFSYKLEQYPEGVGNYKDFIEDNWLGRRTADCIGLIKGYGWLDASDLTIGYAENGVPDYGANQMYQYAMRNGTQGKDYGGMSAMPEIPGLMLWKDGHVGVYIGDGYAIEAMGTKYGVVKTKVEGRGWSGWCKLPYLTYLEE